MEGPRHLAVVEESGGSRSSSSDTAAAAFGTRQKARCLANSSNLHREEREGLRHLAFEGESGTAGFQLGSSPHYTITQAPIGLSARGRR